MSSWHDQRANALGAVIAGYCAIRSASRFVRPRDDVFLRVHGDRSARFGVGNHVRAVSEIITMKRSTA
jgi:hypothetical protein